MTYTQTVFDIIKQHDGIKCLAIANITDKSQNSVSGLLSRLKQQDMIYDSDGKWYVSNVIVNTIKSRLLDINNDCGALPNPWNQGYVSALSDHGIINEKQFDELIAWLRSTPE